MAKAKKNRINADALLKKKSLQGVKKPNPFEIQTTKSKFTILNRDSQPNRFNGVPGVQRARAIEKRKQTLGQEFLVKNKSNRFTDQRKDGRNMTRDQMLSERKSVASRRKEMYNLNESVKLTHKGQTLEEIERFDDAVDNDDDSDEDGGQLDAEFMEAAHFGGGEEGEDRGKDRKTVIEEMIAESKRRKAEKQRENDEIYEMTQKLDKNWQSLVSVVGDHMTRDNERPKLDDYDRIMREMIFERRGAPADKLKSEEELARIEKQKLEKLERERLARMKGEENDTKTKHKSAEDLDDGYWLQPFDGNQEGAVESEGAADGNEESGYDPRNVAKEGDSDQEAENGEDEEESGSEEEEEDDSGDDDADNLSDLKEDSESEEEVVKEKPSKETPKKEVPIVKEVVQKESPAPAPAPAVDSARQAARDKAAAELPFIFELPRKYEQLSELLNQHSPDEQAVIIERMIKSNNVKFARENKSKMISLFAFLLQHLNDHFANVDQKSLTRSFQILDGLTPYFYDLAKMNPMETSSCFLEVLKEKQEEFRKKSRQYAPMDSLIFLKLVPALFSASDFRHPVVTPALVFISHILSRCQVKSRKDVTAGLFLVTTLLECVEQSKRFLPSALNFLNGVLYMCFHKRAVQVVPVVPPFKPSAPLNNLLALENTAATCKEKDFCLRAEDFLLDEIDDSFKLRALNATLGLVKAACHQLGDLAGIHQLSISLTQNLTRLDDSLLPPPLKSSLQSTLTSVKTLHARPLNYLLAPEQKPKPLRLLEPKIEPTYDEIRRRPKKDQLSLRDQRRKLQQKVKRESRAAAREIRQDNEFIAKMQFKQRFASDRERREKVKRIFSDATSQQGELKSLDRKAKYKK